MDYSGSDQMLPGGSGREVGSLAEARVAIILDWFQRYGGSESVVTGMHEIFPQADFFAVLHDPELTVGTPLEGISVRTSFIQALPASLKKYRSYLPLMPLAVEQFDLRSYDLVLSSSHTVAKGVLTSSDQLHVSYTHTPARYAWDLYLDYLYDSGISRGAKGVLARLALHYFRLWDASAANRVDVHLANSSYVARRIEKLYRRPARVVHPPVNVDYYRHDTPREDFFVTVSRFVPYKRLDLIVETFTRMGKRLVVIGDGPDRAKIERAAGPGVELLGYQPDEVIADYLQRARGFVFAADEDFGIVPVEAQAAGCPVIAYRKGGTRETVIGWPAPNATGIFFDSQTPEALEWAIELFETHENELLLENCRINAQRFSRERFQRELAAMIEELWDKFSRTENLEQLSSRRPDS